ncbi:MAG: methyltransferase domain-containing protein [Methanophagales archaeon]|nr:methyltransferase domain-containing protein [Methanophagales archaeon]
MELAFELSGEHETLPKSEVFACLHALSISYAEKIFSEGILVVDMQLSHEALDTLSRRLGMTHCIYEVKGMSKPEEREILAVVKNADMGNIMEQGHTFAVRVKVKSNFISEERKPLSLGRSLERKAGEIIKRKGYKVNLTNPSKTFVLLLTNQTCFFCLLLHATDKKQFEGRKPHLRPFFSPGVIQPKIARALVNLSGIKERELFLDPFCGTGGILIEAGLIGATLVGIDVQEKMVRGAEENLKAYGLTGDLIIGDASKIALQDNSVDAVVTDMPYGRSSLISGSGYFFAESRALFLEGLYQNTLNEVHRVLRTRGKAVIVSNSSSFYSLSHEYNFRILENHKYRVHKSLSRYIAVLERE